MQNSYKQNKQTFPRNNTDDIMVEEIEYTSPISHSDNKHSPSKLVSRDSVPPAHEPMTNPPIIITPESPGSRNTQQETLEQILLQRYITSSISREDVVDRRTSIKQVYYHHRSRFGDVR
jgi:U3 small nucleolar ribonucleoprotein component